MDEKSEKKIVELYLKGFGSTTIAKKIGISKRSILRVLNDKDIIRKRNRCESLDIIKTKNYFVVNRVCPICNKKIETKAIDKAIACRNHYRKVNNNTPCKPCTSKLQSGEGNPFYGKKHTKETLNKLSKTLSDNPRKFSSSSKPEKRIEKIVKDLGLEVVRTFRVKEYICDIYLPKFNLIIEYNGDYWHCNPNKYDANYIHPHKKKPSAQIWNEDNIRIDNIINYNYNLEVIWESDFDEKTTIQNIIKKYETKN
jgi:G:T-mismatch repair DNA endonuclease (very short patch repair protein)